MNYNKVDVLVIMPHPDDAEFSCAGTVARWVRECKSVAYVLLTSGDKGTSDRMLTSQQLAYIRQEEQREAAQILGVCQVEYLCYPDQGLEDSPGLRRDIVRQIRRFCPDTVVTLDPYRRYVWHRDHRIAGQVVLDAVFPYARDHLAYPDLLAEGLEPHKVKEMYFAASEDANCLIDITDTFDLKIKALACHRSQVGDRIQELSEWLKQRAQDAAEEEPFLLAEAFHYIDMEMRGPYRKNDK
ncbi:MAG: PIG-L family deacetylase [Dehalococcoidia bacterium]|nr:PIG-L family deacetylase [Dehalococcoidia bacterium]